MTPQLSIVWQRVVKWGLRVSTGAGVVVSFVALHPFIAGPIALALVAFNFVLERIRFYARVLHVMPFPSDYVIQNKLASLWGTEEHKGEDTILFGQVFRTRRAAKQAYQLFRAWNFCDYIDRNGNIVLCTIREELDRFTIILFPGERGVTEYAASSVAERYGPKTKVVVSKIVFWFVTYADYWKRPNMKAIVERLPDCSRVLLNCYFMQDGEPKAVAKRHLELSKIVIRDRSTVVPGSFEASFQWENPWTGADRETRQKYEPDFQAVNERGEANDI